MLNHMYSTTHLFWPCLSIGLKHSFACTQKDSTNQIMTMMTTIPATWLPFTRHQQPTTQMSNLRKSSPSRLYHKQALLSQLSLLALIVINRCHKCNQHNLHHSQPQLSLLIEIHNLVRHFHQNKLSFSNSNQPFVCMRLKTRRELPMVDNFHQISIIQQQLNRCSESSKHKWDCLQVRAILTRMQHRWVLTRIVSDKTKNRSSVDRAVVGTLSQTLEGHHSHQWTAMLMPLTRASCGYAT